MAQPIMGLRIISAVLQVTTSARLTAALYDLNLTNFSFMIEPIREHLSTHLSQTYEAEKSPHQAYFQKNMNRFAIFEFIMKKWGCLRLPKGAFDVLSTPLYN